MIVISVQHLPKSEVYLRSNQIKISGFYLKFKAHKDCYNPKSNRFKLVHSRHVLNGCIYFCLELTILELRMFCNILRTG